MGVTAQHLGGQHMHHVMEVEPPFLPTKLAVIDHLEQQVPELAGQLIKGASLDGIGNLVGFLEGVRHDRVPILLEIPGAALIGIAQHRHQGQQVIQTVAFAHQRPPLPRTLPWRRFSGA